MGKAQLLTFELTSFLFVFLAMLFVLLAMINFYPAQDEVFTLNLIEDAALKVIMGHSTFGYGLSEEPRTYIWLKLDGNVVIGK